MKAQDTKKDCQADRLMTARIVIPWIETSYNIMDKIMRKVTLPNRKASISPGLNESMYSTSVNLLFSSSSVIRLVAYIFILLFMTQKQGLN